MTGYGRLITGTQHQLSTPINRPLTGGLPQFVPAAEEVPGGKGINCQLTGNLTGVFNGY